MSLLRSLLVLWLFCGLLLAPGHSGAQPLAESTFDSGAESWATSDPDVEHQSSGGRPGGYLEVESAEDVWYWVAPDLFAGDFSAAYNGALRFDLKQSTSSTTLDTVDVVLEGQATTLTLQVSNFPTADWTSYRLPLRPGMGWTVQSTTESASESEIKDVLSSLQAVRIRGNYWQDGGATGLDNVRIQAAQTIERWVDPTQTYLYTGLDSDLEARDAIAINLANLGLSPGDEILLEQPGEYDYDPLTQGTSTDSMVAVFSGSDNLKSADQLDRVPDAIDAGEDINTSGLLPDSDIPEDFLVRGNIITIPSGATHLFLSPYDGVIGDNEDADQDYRLRVQQPSPPLGLKVDGATFDVSLSWSASAFSTVSEYRLYRETAPIDSAAGPGAASLLQTVSSTSYTDESVVEGETYHYRVTAVDDAGNESSLSWEVRATAGSVPSPPSNVQATADGDSSAMVQWQSVLDAAKYRVYRDTASIDTTGGPDPQLLVDSTDVELDTTFVDTTLTPGTTYYYRLTAVDADGLESEYSAEVTARPPLSMLAASDTAVVAQADTMEIEVLANDLPGEAAAIDTASLRIAEGPSHGQATVNKEAGTIEYVHDGTDNFEDVFYYSVEDTEARSDFAQVTLSIKSVALTAERDTVRLGRGQVDAIGKSARLAFTSAGDTAAAGLSLKVSNQADYSLIEDTDEEILQPGEKRAVRVGFQPDEVGPDQTTSVTLATDTGIKSTVVLVGTGIDAQVSAGRDVAAEGTPVDVSVTPLGPFEPTSRRLYARLGGGTYQEMDDPSQIPGSFVTTKGVDYYVVLTEGEAKVVLPGGSEAAARRDPFHLPVTFEKLSAPLSLAPQTYRMVSIPARVPVKKMLQKSYGGYNPSDWRVLRWGPSEGTYREFPELDSLGAGMGFWLVTAGGNAFTLGAGRTVDASSPQQVVLERGWNQVGTPFNFSVPWDTIQAASGLSGAQIDGPIGYRPSEGYQLGRSVLKPWESYFVFNATGSRDTLVVPPVGASSKMEKRAGDGPDALAGSRLWTASPSAQRQSEETSGASEGASKRAADRPYTLRVAARSKEGNGRAVWLGLREEAETGRDALDVAQAPSIGQSIRLSVQERVQGRTVPHAGSFKPREGEGQAWTLVLERPARQTGGAQSVRLQLQAEGALPSGQKQYLLDLKEGRRLVSGATLSLKPGEPRRLKVIVGTKRFAQKKSDGIALERYENALRGNTPNPFRGKTTLTYVLEEETTVTLEVYNVLGQRVRTLVQGRREAGVHRVRWNGKNRYGEPAGSGVYFYRITAGDFQKTRKMVLVR